MNTPDLSDPWKRNDYAQETHRMALDLYDYIFPPWRWLEWHRRAKVIRQRIKLLRASMNG